jgi:acyl carrier protein
MTPTDVGDVVAEFIRTRFRASLPGGVLHHGASLFSTGVVDSFGVLELIAFLEDRFEISIDTGRHELRDFDSVSKIADLVDRVRRGL